MENKPTRRFFKCRECLAVMVSESPALKGLEGVSGPKCTCGGSLKYMGHVRRQRLVDVSERAACDGRCTNAPGPSCDCTCGGENHGTHRIVEVIHDLGPVPQLRSPNPERAETFRAAREATIAAFESTNKGLLQALDSGERLPVDLWTRARYFRSDLRAAGRVASVKGRLAAYAELAAKHAPKGL